MIHRPILLASALRLFPHASVGFAPSLSVNNNFHSRPERTLTKLKSETQPTSLVESSAEGFPSLTGALKNCELHEFVLQNHKPLGCSVEESLADEPDRVKYVFVAQLTEGGNADKAGIQVGDVVVQLSGTFDEVMDVAGLGLDKIRSLVSGRLKEQPLTIRVARGSDVMERHESALVDLCILGEDPETVECITSIHSQDDDQYYNILMNCEDSDAECMLDSMWEDWTDGLPINIHTGEESEPAEEWKEEKKKVTQPWASRASGSGTWVRDPATGKMRNIDE